MSQERSIATVISDLLGEFTALFRNELRLARVEAGQKLGLLGAGIGLIAGGGAVLFAGFIVLLQAAVDQLADSGISRPLAALIVAVVAMVAGLVVVLIGKSRFKPANLAPSKTVHQLQRDAEVVKYQVSPS
ncbi:MAG TPA: phage holin family protein [Rhizomicrobium sp.]